LKKVYKIPQGGLKTVSNPLGIPFFTSSGIRVGLSSKIGLSAKISF
jgi:hypothetical protein